MASRTGPYKFLRWGAVLTDQPDPVCGLAMPPHDALYHPTCDPGRGISSWPSRFQNYVWVGFTGQITPKLNLRLINMLSKPLTAAIKTARGVDCEPPLPLQGGISVFVKTEAVASS